MVKLAMQLLKILKNLIFPMHLVSILAVISSYDNKYYLPRFFLNERFGEKDRFEFAVNAYSLNVKNFTN